MPMADARALFRTPLQLAFSFPPGTYSPGATYVFSVFQKASASKPYARVAQLAPFTAPASARCVAL